MKKREMLNRAAQELLNASQKCVNLNNRIVIYDCRKNERNNDERK